MPDSVGGFGRPRRVAVLAALMLAFAANAADIPPLIQGLSRVPARADAPPVPRGNVLDAIRNDPAASALRIGLSAPEAARDSRAVTVTLAGAAGGGRDVTLSFEALGVEQRAEDDYSLHGRDPDTGAEISLVVIGTDVIGTIRHDGETWNVRPLGGGVTAIYHYDTSAWEEHPDAVPVPALPAEGSMEGPETGSADPARDETSESGAFIDMLVAHTPAARSEAGNGAALARLAVDETNVVYE